MLYPQFGLRPPLDPYREMRRLQEELNRVFGATEAAPEGEFPPVNMWVGEHDVIVTARLPGVAPEDVDVSMHEDTLTIKGTRRPEAVEGGAVYRRRERTFGEFSRTIRLPFAGDPDHVEARLADGELEIKIMRPEAERPRRIPVRAA